MKRLSFLLVILLLGFALLGAIDRPITCTVTTTDKFTPGGQAILGLSFNILSGYHADCIKLTFPTGFTINGGSPMGSVNGVVTGQKIQWGTDAWEGSGSGPLSGSYNVSVQVTATANVLGDQNIAVYMMGDDPESPDEFSSTLVLHQVVNGPVVSVSPKNIYAGEVSTGSESIKNVTISNIGINELDITSITSSNPAYTIVNDYSGNIAAGQSFTLQIKYAPTTVGFVNSDITISSNGGPNQIIVMQGIGMKPTYTVESFENGFPPTGWTDVDDDWISTTESPKVGLKNAKLGYNGTGILSTPKLNIQAGDKIMFSAGNHYYAAGNLVVKISTDRVTWTELLNEPTIKGYKDYEINLSAFTGPYYIGFTKTGDRFIKLDQVVMPQIDMTNVVPDPIRLVSPTNALQNAPHNSILSWTADGFATGYKLSLGTNPEADNILNAQDVANVTQYTPSLGWNTTYYWKVMGYNSNGNGASSQVYSFKTEVNSVQSIPYTENFTTFPPTFWKKAKGQLTNNVTFTSTTDSQWGADGFANDGTTGAARMNIYNAGQFEWLITPTIDLATLTDLKLNFDIALTKFSGTTATVLSADDKVAVVISTDNGQTWSQSNVLKEWHSTDTISNTGDQVCLDLAAYSGLVKIGFYAESTVANPRTNTDINVYIDNISVIQMGDAPVLRITPETFTFSEIKTGSTSTPKQFDVAKLGTGTVRIDNIILENETNFNLTNLPTSFPVELTSTTLSFNAVYTPQTTGTHTTNIQIITNDGTFNASISGSAYTPVAGDLITNAINIALNAEGTFTATGSNTQMHNDYDLPDLDGKDIVYKLAIENPATVNISLEGSSYNTRLAVYQVSNDSLWVPGSDNYLFYNDDYNLPGKSSRAIWSALRDMALVAGNYYVVIDAYSTSEGTYSISVDADITSNEPEINIAPQTINFTEMVIGKATDNKTFTLSNGGTAPYTIQSIAINNDVDFEMNLTSSLPQTVLNNQYGFTVKFTPQSAGEKTATITVLTNVGSRTLTVSGTALQAGMTWESFEGENFPAAGWSTIDTDGDNHNFCPWSGTYARTGDGFAMSNSGSMWGDDYDPDNWMVTPKLTVRNGDKLIWYVRPMNPTIPGDHYEVKLSTTGNTASDFSVQLRDEIVSADVWIKKEIDLSAYANQNVYLAFHHIDNGEDCYAFAIDDVFMPPLSQAIIPETAEILFPEDDTDYIYGMSSLLWNSAAYAAGYKLSLGTNNPPTNLINNEDIGNVTSKTIYNLLPNTTYYWKVTPYNTTGQAQNVAINHFTTAEFEEYNQPYSNDFNNCTSMPFFPLGWTDFKGLIGDDNTQLVVNDFMGWVTSNFGNMTSNNKALNIEVDGDELRHWAVSPSIDLGSNNTVAYQARFDLSYNTMTTTNPGTWGSDDKVAFVISTDNGLTWKKSNILKVWNQNNPVSNLGQTCSIDLTGYSGKVRVAFYAESTDQNGSGKFFVDNFFLGEQVTVPLINVLPNSYAFPLTQVNHLTDAKTFRVVNIGVDTLNVSSVAIVGSDAANFILQDNNSYPQAITNGQFTFNVIFRPTSIGQKTAQIAVTDQNGTHNYEVTGHAYGTNGDTTADPIIVQFTNNLYTALGSTSNFNNDYEMPAEGEGTDSKDVVYKVTFTNPVTMHAGLSNCNWDTQLAVYSADVVPGPDNWLYYNDDSEEMKLARTGKNIDRQSRGYNSIITQMHLEAGSYYIVVDGSTKTGWFDAFGDYKIDIQAKSFAAPTALTATMNNSHAQLSWTAPVVIDGNLMGYVVLRNTTAVSGLVTSTSYTDNDVVAGYTYQYSVLAVYDNLTGVSTPSNTVNFTFGEAAANYVTDSFEDYDNFAINFTPWTLNNVDGMTNFGIENYTWANMAEPYAFMVFNPASVTPTITFEELLARTGSKYAVHFGSDGATNNDWLISKKLELGTQSSVNFYAKTFTTQYGAEKFRVAVSTTDTNPASFNYLDADTLRAVTNWNQYVYDLSAFDHQDIYVGIQVVGTDGFIFMLDDFNVKSNNPGAVVPDPLTLVTELTGNYPNPFNPTTSINFSLAKDSNVNLAIYNVKGQKVKTLINNKMTAGKHNIVWDGKDSNNRQTASGVYFYRFEADNYKKVNKMIMMK